VPVANYDHHGCARRGGASGKAVVELTIRHCVHPVADLVEPVECSHEGTCQTVVYER
jgi:hypothetical protein